MQTTDLDPVITAVLESLIYDTSCRKLYFKGEEVPGSSFGQWRLALPPRLYAHFHIGNTRIDEHIESLFPDIDADLRIVSNTPVKFRDCDATICDVAYGSDGKQNGVFVYIGALKVFIPNNRIVKQTSGSVCFRTATLRPRLSAGFMFFIGSQITSQPNNLLRIYCGASKLDSLLPVWRSLVQYIMNSGVSVRMKLLSRVCEYPRRDALVVYVDECALDVVPDVIDIVERSMVPEVSHIDPCFAKRITSNIMCAWEPMDVHGPSNKESFGQQRARRISEGVLNGLERGENIKSAVVSSLIDGNIDPTAVYRNLDSPTFPVYRGMS